MAKFTKSFDQIVCVGDKIDCTINGFSFQARIAHDLDYCIDDDDAHSTDQNVTGCDAEQQEKLSAARDSWNRNEWFYCGIIISARHIATGAFWDHVDSLWGIEANYPGSDNTYLNEAASEILTNAIAEVRSKLRELCAVTV